MIVGTDKYTNIMLFVILFTFDIPCDVITDINTDTKQYHLTCNRREIFSIKLKTNFSPDPFPGNLPLFLTDWFHSFYPACVRKSLALKTLVSAAD